jgi:hypothetical protein
MPIERDNPFACDHLGCDALRRGVNHWYIVLVDNGVHVYKWDEAPKKAMEEGYHFCGLAHTINFVSNVLTPHNKPDPNKESTIEFKPPLDREGKAPEPKEEVATEVQE